MRNVAAGMSSATALPLLLGLPDPWPQGQRNPRALQIIGFRV